MNATLRMTSMALLIAEVVGASPAWAQATASTAPSAPAHGDEVARVVVSGIRASLSSSLSTKRLQDGVVDAVSAEDAGKFPDTNVAESLQRITGVQIQRDNGEGRYISVRGLGPEFNNVLVNGRTMTSDTGGREF
ncbi:MAG: TonB-dependent receptor plug domain-containing protein, partial [Gammaproteobacteria bacterium]